MVKYDDVLNIFYSLWNNGFLEIVYMIIEGSDCEGI